MSGGHAHRLYRPGDSSVHRLPPQCKIVAALAFVVAVVATPREQMWAFGLYALVLAAVAAVARVAAGFLARRMLVEVPFIAFALWLPFIVHGRPVEIAGLTVSSAGLWAAWNILAKATLGITASILLGATTEQRTVLIGVERLGLPPILVQIASFMLRYADVILDELRRMRIARMSRGFVARDIRHVRTLARSLSAVFLRSYERGERVYVAMASRGYDGRSPVIRELPVSAAQWAAAGLVPAVAAATATVAWAVN